MRPSSIAQVVASGLCTGCGACVILAGRDNGALAESAAGFLRPRIGVDACAGSHDRLIDVCPGVSVTHEGLAEGPAFDPVWGRRMATRVVHASDPALRDAASSGGGLSAQLAFMLQSGQIDGVVHTAAAPGDPSRSTPRVSSTAEQLLEAVGSRYAPSAPLTGIHPQLFGSLSRIAFVGKPCDVSALHRLARYDKRLAERVVLAVSFFCAGVPSQRATTLLIRRLGFSLEDVALVRYRGHGWPGRFTVRTRSGEERSLAYEEAWGTVLNQHVQYRCRICPDGIGEFADLCYADAWRTDSRDRVLCDDLPGESLVIARTQRGLRALDGALEHGSLELTTEELEPERLCVMQPYQYQRRTTALARLWGHSLATGWMPRFDRRALRAASAGTALHHRLRAFASALRRGLRYRLHHRQGADGC